MSIDNAIKRIDKYLSKENVQPLIVDAQNIEDLQAIKTHYNVGNSIFIATNKYCSKDEFPQMEELFNELLENAGNLFVTGLSVYLKLKGEQYLKDKLKSILSICPAGHVVVLTYQCKKYLSFYDPRLKNRIIIIDGTEDSKSSMVFTTDNFVFQKDAAKIVGIENLVVLEESVLETAYIITGKTRSHFPLSLIAIKNLNKAYDVLCTIDRTTAEISETLGTENQWEYALQQFDKKNTWSDVVSSIYGNHKALDLAIQNYPTFDSNQQWLYFIALKLFGASNNWCLNKAAASAEQSKDLIRQLYRSILGLDPNDKKFAQYYQTRKQMLKQIGNPLDEVVDYCKIILSKGKNAIYYLTDNTAKEKEQIFFVLDKYGTDFTKEELISILQLVYPDLAAYLSTYRFKHELWNQYFDLYKYQKIINKIIPEFETLVIEQAEKREYNVFLPSRASLVEGIDKTGAQLYFIDALGVEYLSYIVSVCKELSLMTKISICQSELPTITSKNKEFLEAFAGSEHPVISIKDVDEIKHHGKYNYDYQQTKLPFHLSKELDTIREVLTKIKEKLASGSIKKAIIISDHGASRLAVIHETENIFEMAEKGEHSGRCCLKNEVDEQPSYATDAGDFWVLANYDRFKGGRKASVEVHGGATLEEVTVPIIELSYHAGETEVRIMPVDAQTYDLNTVPEITVSHRKKAVIKVYVSEFLPNIYIQIDGKTYDAKPMDNNYYIVEMPEIKRPKTYSVDVYSGDNPIAEKLPLKVKSEGMTSNNKGIL